MRIDIVFIFLVAVSLSFAGCGGSSESGSGGQSASSIAQDSGERFVLYDLNGQQRRWSEFLGKPLMVNFWATWCGPCRREIPLLVKIYEDYHPRGLEIVGISIDHQRDRVAPFISQFNVPYVILYSDNDAPVEFELGRGIPVTIFFDAEGNETGRITGAQLPPFFYRELKKLFAD